MGKAQRDKGARSERQLIDVMNLHFGTDAKRELEQVRSGGLDVTDEIPFSIEIKSRAKKPAVQKFLEQAADSARQGCPPIAIVKGDREPPIVVMYMSDWLMLAQHRVDNYKGEHRGPRRVERCEATAGWGIQCGSVAGHAGDHTHIIDSQFLEDGS